MALRTQTDALEAIKARCAAIPLGSVTSGLAANLAETGLRCPPAALTPAQQVADTLLAHVFAYEKELVDDLNSGDCSSTWEVEAGMRLSALSALLEPFRPAPAPTLGEALAEMARRACDVLEGLEGEKLSGAMPARVAKLRAAVDAAERVPK